VLSYGNVMQSLIFFLGLNRSGLPILFLPEFLGFELLQLFSEHGYLFVVIAEKGLQNIIPISVGSDGYVIYQLDKVLFSLHVGDFHISPIVQLICFQAQGVWENPVYFYSCVIFLAFLDSYLDVFEIYFLEKLIHFSIFPFLTTGIKPSI
jgi:hypothetical protein